MNLSQTILVVSANAGGTLKVDYAGSDLHAANKVYDRVFGDAENAEVILADLFHARRRGFPAANAELAEKSKAEAELHLERQADKALAHSEAERAKLLAQLVQSETKIKSIQAENDRIRASKSKK